ncbi:MAG TPA: hypothetical protein VJ946_06575 [Bacteroidales bacterium]|nr:hypothetical protein [Bacteroidales bacterium]
MNVRQLNRKNMLDAVNSYLDENVSIWQSIAILATAKTRLNQTLIAVDVAQAAQAEAQVTIGKSKLALKKAIATKADVLNDLVEAHALIEGDDELARQMGDTKSDLFRASYSDFFIKVKAIIEKATEFQEVLVNDYGMTAEQVTDIQNDLNRLLEINGQPRAYQIKSIVATNEIEQLLTEANDVLTNQMDKLISIFKRRDPNFYHGYQKARMIVD